MQVMRWSSVKAWLKVFLSWMAMEFDVMVAVKHEQLGDLVMAIAGAFIVQDLPLRVLSQVLYDLIQNEEVKLARLLCNATVTMASTTKRGSEIMKLVKSALLAKEQPGKRKLDHEANAPMFQ
jgi:hypothetical protein